MTGSPSYQDRRHALTTALEESDLNAAVLLTPASIAYYTGNLISAEAALVNAEDSWFVLSPEYDTYNFAMSDPALEIHSYSHRKSLETALAKSLATVPAPIGLEMAGLSALKFRALETLSGLSFEDCDLLISRLKAVKDFHELEQIRTAARITQRVYSEVVTLLQEPQLESDIAAFVYRRLIELGSEHMASQPYVKSGERALMTHARWSGRRVDPADHLLLEFGACVNRYHAPLMRTRLRSDASRAYETARKAVVEARDAVLDILQPGASSRDVYRAYVEPLERNGVAHMNRHALGYSVGLAFPPSWSEPSVFWIDGLSDSELREGTVLHLVPGLVDANESVEHIGLSELVTITRSGAERLLSVPDFL